MTLPLDNERSLIDRLDAARSRDEILLFKLHAYELVPGGASRILDVGAGTGDDALALSERLGPDTEIVGIESRSELVEEAKRRARNVALNVRFMEGELLALPFLDGVFPIVRADGLLGRGLAPEPLFRELVRVLSPGGTLLVHEWVPDLEQLSAPAQRPTPDSIVQALTFALERDLIRTSVTLRALSWPDAQLRESHVHERAETVPSGSGFSLVVSRTESRTNSR